MYTESDIYRIIYKSENMNSLLNCLLDSLHHSCVKSLLRPSHNEALLMTTSHTNNNRCTFIICGCSIDLCLLSLCWNLCYIPVSRVYSRGYIVGPCEKSVETLFVQNKNKSRSCASIDPIIQCSYYLVTSLC